MKHYLTIFLFLSLWSCSFAQDWAPVRVGETYHYRWYPSVWGTQYPQFNTSFFPSNLAVQVPIDEDEFSIRVDSLISIGLDSEYQYQQRFDICDTCSLLGLREVLEGDSIGLFPKFIQKASGGYTLVYNEDTLELTNNLQVVSTTNTAYNVYVSSTYWNNIYDNFNLHIINTSPVYDSIIYIAIDDTNNTTYPFLYEMEISKNNGLIYWGSKDFFWQIIGIEGNGNESGFETLDFGSIYDFNVGDQFYYHKYIFESSGSSSWPYPTNVLEFWYRWKILNRQDVGTDTIHYSIERVYYGQGYPVFPNLGVADTFNKTYIHSEDSFYTMEDRELRYKYGVPSGMVGCKNLFSTTGNNMKHIGYDFQLTAEQSGYWMDTFISIFNQYPVNYYHGDLSLIYDFSTLYHKGLGRAYEGNWYMDGTYIRELIGYIKGTDTVGSTPSITIYTDLKEPSKKEYTIKCFENPTKNYLKVHYQNQEIKQNLSFSILDVMGRSLSTYEETDISDKTYVFPVQHLTNGLYFLEIRQDGNLLETKQFIKQ